MGIHFINKEDSDTSFRAMFQTNYDFREANTGFTNFIDLASGSMSLENIRVLQEDYDRRYSKKALNDIATLQSRFNTSFSDNLIKPLKTLEELQLASPINRRYVMSHPVISGRYNINAINGYDGDFNNPKGVNYDYQDAINTLDRKVDGKLVATTYHSSKGEYELLPVQKSDIYKTFKAIDTILESSEIRADLTSVWNDIF